MFRAKVKVETILKHANGETVTFKPVSGDDNKSWTKWTPSGEMKLDITNPELVGKFTINQVFIGTFEEAPLAEADEKK